MRHDRRNSSYSGRGKFGLQAKLDSVKTPSTATGMPWVTEEPAEEPAD